MALIETHRQLVYRLPPPRRANWRRLEGLLEAERQLYNAAQNIRDRGLKALARSASGIGGGCTARGWPEGPPMSRKINAEAPQGYSCI